MRVRYGMRSRFPVPRDVDAAADPDAVVLARRGRESAAAPRCGPGRPSRRQCMPTLIIFGARRLRRTARRSVAQVVEEVVAVREALRQREAHVVGVERVGHDQLRHDARRRCFAPASRTAGRRRSSRCRTRSRRGRRPAAACSGCRGRCTSRAARSPVTRSMTSIAAAHVLALGRLVDLPGSGSSASRGRRSRGPSSTKAAASSGWRCSAMPTPNTVSGRPRCSNSRRIRQTPAREPYS